MADKATDEDKRSARWSFGPALTRREAGLMALLALGYLAAAFYIIIQGSPLGHDESVYALRARHLVDGGSSSYFWANYRAPGLPRLLQLTWGLGATEPYLRAVVAGFGLLLVTTTWLLGRYLFNVRAGLIAATGVAFTPFFLMSATQVWPDVPGAALGLVALAILVFGTNGERASWWILLIAPVATVAVLVRFGAPIPIAVGLAGIAIWRWRVVRRSIPQLATAALLTLGGGILVLFVPAVTGNSGVPFTAVQNLRTSRDFPPWQGFVDYARQADFLLGGALGFLLVAGLALGLVYALQGRLGVAYYMVVGAGLATFAAISLSLHGESRYLTPVLPLLWLGAGAALAIVNAALDSRAQLVVLLALVLYLPLIGITGDAEAQNEFNSVSFQVLKDASNELQAEVGSEPCGVVTSYTPQVGWYSGCITRSFNLGEVTLTSSHFPDSGPSYLMWVRLGKRQPEGDLRAEYLGATEELVFTAGDDERGKLRYIEVYRIKG